MKSVFSMATEVHLDSEILHAVSQLRVYLLSFSLCSFRSPLVDPTGSFLPTFRIVWWMSTPYS